LFRCSDVAVIQLFQEHIEGIRIAADADGRDQTVNDELGQQYLLLTDLLGRPLGLHIDPAWLVCNGAVAQRMPQSIYEDRALERMPILAGALVEAGCCVPRSSQANRDSHVFCPFLPRNCMKR
jgi:hypothetical protein